MIVNVREPSWLASFSVFDLRPNRQFSSFIKKQISFYCKLDNYGNNWAKVRKLTACIMSIGAFTIACEYLMIGVLRILCIGLATVTLFGCVSSSANEAKALQSVPSATSNSEGLLNPGDKVQITVFGEDRITGEYALDQAGVISVPLAGSVKADGTTSKDLEERIAALLREKFLRNPRVTVTVTSLRPFYILGEVEKPGEYAFKTGLNIWRAMAVAGGQTYRASSSFVLIQHAGEQKMAEYDLSQDITVRPGDLIRVPERWF